LVLIHPVKLEEGVGGESHRMLDQLRVGPVDCTEQPLLEEVPVAKALPLERGRAHPVGNL